MGLLYFLSKEEPIHFSESEHWSTNLARRLFGVVGPIPWRYWKRDYALFIWINVICHSSDERKNHSNALKQYFNSNNIRQYIDCALTSSDFYEIFRFRTFISSMNYMLNIKDNF